MSYTALGDTVNLASRLESLNKYYGTYLLVGEATMQAVKGRLSSRLVDRVAVKGKTKPIGIYELLSDSLTVEASVAKAMNAYREGLSRYFDQQWDQARAQFETVLQLKPSDGPSNLMIKRCETMKLNPPGVDWDGVTIMQDK